LLSRRLGTRRAFAAVPDDIIRLVAALKAVPEWH
jgi:hypothetical protein